MESWQFPSGREQRARAPWIFLLGTDYSMFFKDCPSFLTGFPCLFRRFFAYLRKRRFPVPGTPRQGQEARAENPYINFSVPDSQVRCFVRETICKAKHPVKCNCTHLSVRN